MIEHSRLLQILNYDPATGLFTWLVSPRKNTPAGSIAGCEKPNGYVRITIDGIGYQAHRLAWFYVYGVWPENKIDHENRKRSDNRWGNLREATSTQNLANAKRPSHNTSGFKGVSWNKVMRKWLAQIQVHHRNINLGYFDTPSAAHQAYLAAAQKYFGEFTRAA